MSNPAYVTSRQPDPALRQDYPTTTAPYYEDERTGIYKTLAIQENQIPAVRWSGVMSGVFLGLGTELLLSLLGAAIGITSVLSYVDATSRSFTVGSGIWLAIQMIVAALVGGFFAARNSKSYRKSDGMIAGLVSWSVVATIGAMITGVATAAVGAATAVARQQAAAAGIAGNEDQVTGAAWLVFGIAVITAAVSAGAGAVGARKHPSLKEGYNPR